MSNARMTIDKEPKASNTIYLPIKDSEKPRLRGVKSNARVHGP